MQPPTSTNSYSAALASATGSGLMGVFPGIGIGAAATLAPFASSPFIGGLTVVYRSGSSGTVAGKAVFGKTQQPLAGTSSEEGEEGAEAPATRAGGTGLMLYIENGGLDLPPGVEKF